VKKKLYFIAPLLLIFAFSSCQAPDEKKDDPPPPKTLDQRLVGDRWYYSDDFRKPGNNGYLEFFADNKMSYIYPKNHLMDKTDIPVYSKDGVVYKKENDNWILEYGFYNKFPYTDINGVFLITSNDRYLLNQYAEGNNIIVCPSAESLVNAIFSGVPNYKYQFLIRFHEDGTPFWP